MRKIIEIDEELCDGCGKCVSGCVEGALQVIVGKARVVSDRYCDGLGDCVGDCPTGTLKIIEREATPFDEKAVEQHLMGKGLPTLPCGCPSTNIQTFEASTSCQEASDVEIPMEEVVLSTREKII